MSEHGKPGDNQFFGFKPMSLLSFPNAGAVERSISSKVFQDRNRCGLLGGKVKVLP
jgi:hypothetical protein